MTHTEAEQIAKMINDNTEHEAIVTYDVFLDPDKRMIDGFDVQITVK